MTTEKKELVFDIENGPPELDLLFALVRGNIMSFTIRTRGISKESDFFIDALISQRDELRSQWVVKGRFWGDGVSSWSSFEFLIDRERREKTRYKLWGEFRAMYDKRTRKGRLVTGNFEVETVSIDIN